MTMWKEFARFFSTRHLISELLRKEYGKLKTVHWFSYSRGEKGWKHPCSRAVSTNKIEAWCYICHGFVLTSAKQSIKNKINYQCLNAFLVELLLRRYSISIIFNAFFTRLNGAKALLNAFQTRVNL